MSNLKGTIDSFFKPVNVKPAEQSKVQGPTAEAIKGSEDSEDIEESNPRKKAKPIRPAKTDGKKKGTGSLKMHRRRLGDAVKARINVTKWCVEAKTSATAGCDLDIFKALIVPNAVLVTPSSFDLETPVVLAQITGAGNIGEIFGKTKITGGTRLGSWTANEMDIIFYPKSNQITCWWTMQ